MILDRVTITGADDRVDQRGLIDLNREYPFVEWAILFSASRVGTSRYPSRSWVERLTHIARPRLVSISAHLCGRWARDAIAGDPSWWGEHADIAKAFHRIQINTGGRKVPSLAAGLADILELDHEFILQHDGANNTMVEFLVNLPANQSNVCALRDLSGGEGKLGSWEPPLCSYTGYAGGLTPENVAEQLALIANVAGDARVWIDVETGVRTEGDVFDLGKAERFLAAAKPFVDERFRGR